MYYNVAMKVDIADAVEVSIAEVILDKEAARLIAVGAKKMWQICQKENMYPMTAQFWVKVMSENDQETGRIRVFGA